MNETVLTTIAFTGFSVAFFHAAIPTHWLPFVATGRAQGWSHLKTLAVTAFAGSGHVFATAALGFLLTVFGVAINAQTSAIFPWIAGGLLIALGLFYIWRQLSGRGHSHTHLSSHSHSRSLHRHEEPNHFHSQNEITETIKHLHPPDVSESRTSDRLAITSLFALLTFSPCEAFLPIYVSGVRFGWGGFALLTLILSAATVAGMLLFTSLALTGIRNFRVDWFEQYESGVMGCLLFLIGLLVVLVEK